MGFSVTFQLPYLRENGPTCHIIITPSDPTVEKLKLEKARIPKIKVLALIDTGASSTAISRRVVEKLNLIARGTAKVYTSHKEPEIRNEYDIALEFDTDAYLPLLRVLGANLQNHSIDCLIGRDILHHGKLIYNGAKNQIKLSF